MDPAAGTQDAPRQTILVVDDEPNNIEVVGEFLRPFYTIKVATSGERALRIARAEPHPDLILLDIMMPGMDGYEVLRELRASPLTGDLPVIFLTGIDQDEGKNETKGLKLGAVDYLNKPIRLPILLARVRTQLELKRARDVLRNWNGELQKEVKRRTRENELIKEVTLHALATLAEARDHETGNHIVRTQFYVEALAQQLLRRREYVEELGQERRIQQISRAAPLHDIGKVGIPDSILRKPGKLTPDEFEVMKGHARIGADAIDEAIRRVSGDNARNELGDEALEFLHTAREIAGNHHEKWDGTGYPLGIAGPAIPLSARLMALADVFDALTCRRVYKEPLPHDEVIRIIGEGRGRHFDPAVVDAFFEVEAEFMAISQRYLDTP